ncbi:MAG: GAF domain-containing protein [Deltaproteobacteria bacterium]|nr:GAF domain-containing protein [Deltaproteobacteria bacterium]
MFRLLRYFSLTSLITTATVAVLLGMFYRQLAVRDLISLKESENVSLTRSFANSLWPQFIPFVASTSGLRDHELRAHPEITKLRHAVLSQMRGLPVVKVKVYSLEGRTVFSTEAEQIGENKSDNRGFLSARLGKVASELTHRDTFSAFEHTLADRDIISSYIPIRSGLTGPVEAVFEVYSDVTPFLRNLERTQKMVMIGVTVILALLYFALFFIVRHADKVIARQHAEAKQYLQEIKVANETLEERVKQRTQDLSKINEELEAEIIGRKRAEEKLLFGLERIRALHEIDMAITSTLDLRTVLDVLLAKIDRLLPYPTATMVRLVNRETGELKPVACKNLDEAEWKAATAGSEATLAKMLPEKHAPVMSRNACADPRSLAPEFLRKYGLVSYLRVPLIAMGEVLGIITYCTKEAHEFSNDEVEFLSTLAGQAAIAIHNSQLYEDTANLAAELSQSNKVKDEFLSVMSHELRTPLNVVLGYTGMIRDGVLGEINREQEKALDKVMSHARDQSNMIGGILQATQMEADGLKAEIHEVSLRDFLSDLRSSYEIPLRENVRLVWDHPPDLPVIRTDAEKLKHVLQNLINNAIKFTENGRVTVSVRLLPPSGMGRHGDTETRETGDAEKRRTGDEGSGEDTDSPVHPISGSATGSWVEFKVADTGIGIPKEFLPVIFEKFRQLDSSETRRYGGVGIGLFIAKKFTELLGGNVEVESEPGKGSTFTVTLPCESCQAAGDSQEGKTQE